jgi:hypothetical protein
VSLVTGGGHGLTPAVAEAGGSAPERTRESATAIEAVGRHGAAPEMAGPRRAAFEQGSKRAALETGLSDRPMKKARVCSKM